MVQWSMQTKVGRIYIVASERGLVALSWARQPAPMISDLSGSSRAIKMLARVVTEVEEYFSGQRRKFSVPIHLRGTPFQMQVWEELRKIPYGETLSYREVARRIGRPKAFRAVGSANGRNPVAIVVPCHRVIAADNGLGGFSGGLKNKVTLLGIEGISVD